MRPIPAYRIFLNQIAAKIAGGESFPHEIGIILGYPPEDIEGFKRYKGRNFKCCGYWKVYGNAERAQKMFDAYTLCREKLMQALQDGVTLKSCCRCHITEVLLMEIAVIYWSGTGNTKMMAEAVAEGIAEAGAQAGVKSVSEITPDEAAAYDKIAFGCSAMGAEVLEETEFEPFFTMVEDNLKGKKVVLFGSYGWGGSYMQDWEARVQADGAELLHPGVLAMGEPDDAARQECKEIGSLLAKA